MTSRLPTDAVPAPSKTSAQTITKLFTAKEAAALWRVSESFLAKARMDGTGPAFIKVGRSIRYSEAALQQWMKGRLRISTSEDDSKQCSRFE